MFLSHYDIWDEVSQGPIVACALLLVFVLVMPALLGLFLIAIGCRQS